MAKRIREAVFPIDDVLPYVTAGKPPQGKDKVKSRPQRIYAGKTVHMDSLRYQTFLKSGTACVSCGLKATYFALERQPGNGPENRYHLNLYGTDSFGREILFTKDHVVPRKHGGSDDISNLQTMCYPCNIAKGCADETMVVYKRSRSRIKRLRRRINKRLAKNKQLRKTAFVSGTSDGGPEYLALKRQREQLLKRAKFLDKEDARIRSERQEMFKLQP